MGTYVLTAGAVNTNSGPLPWHHGGSIWDCNWTSFPPSLPGEYLLRFDVDTAAIVLDGAAPIGIAFLPPGFTPTSATLHAQVQGGSNVDGESDGYLQFGPILDEGPVIHLHITSQDRTYVHPGPIPAAIDLINNGFGIRVVLTGVSQPHAFVTDAASATPMRIEGAYTIQAWWQTGDDYIFGDDPGGGATPVDTPTPRIDSIVPNSGPTSGGTSVTITGAGFWNPDGTLGVEAVLFDGEFPGTSVVVSDEHTLTCVTPAHWKGTKDVVVVLDFAP